MVHNVHTVWVFCWGKPGGQVSRSRWVKRKWSGARNRLQTSLEHGPDRSRALTQRHHGTAGGWLTVRKVGYYHSGDPAILHLHCRWIAERLYRSAAQRITTSPPLWLSFVTSFLNEYYVCRQAWDEFFSSFFFLTFRWSHPCRLANLSLKHVNPFSDWQGKYVVC